MHQDSQLLFARLCYQGRAGLVQVFREAGKDLSLRGTQVLAHYLKDKWQEYD